MVVHGLLVDHLRGFALPCRHQQLPEPQQVFEMRRIEFNHLQMVGPGFGLPSHPGQQRGPLDAQSHFVACSHLPCESAIQQPLVEQPHPGIAFEPRLPLISRFFL